MNRINGSCLCGSMRYEAQGCLRPVVACHCHQCRKALGHYGAATRALRENVIIRGETLKWFQSSQKAERAFCAICGSSLFWREIGSHHISIWAGTIDGPTGLRMESQIYPESAGDYYEIPDILIIEQSDLK